ncbi:hypothetical protein EDB87DRAFT_160742 [Lactarius vividus]|nr:hypothetical protein EDB87DRAFT_160742 [Lactarius vividus]
MVLVHDDDLVRLDGFDDATSSDTLRGDVVATHLRHSKPEIREVPFHTDLPSSSKDANSNTQTVRAAMLSGSHIFEGQPPFPPPTSSGLVRLPRTITPNSNSPDRLGSNSTLAHFHSLPISGAAHTQNEVLFWTSQDPRRSQLFSSRGVIYRFQTDTNAQGQSITSLWRAIRLNREDRVAKLEWALDGGFGRVVIGMNILPMTEFVRQDPRMPNSRVFNGPDGLQYRWRPSINSQDIVLQDRDNNVIAFIRPTRPTRYRGLEEVHAELHFLRSAGAGIVMHPPFMDMVTVTAMLYRFASAFDLGQASRS